MSLLDQERLDKLTERLTRLEKDVREYWSKSLEQEARISELEEKLNAHYLNHAAITSGPG